MKRLNSKDWQSANKQLISDFLQKQEEITLFDWECPPRFLSTGKNGKKFINFDVDFGRIFKGEIIDKYTELPRCVIDVQTESRCLELFQKSGIKFKYCKLIADTNAYYLAQDSLGELGKRKVLDIFENFKRYIYQAVKKYPVPVEVCLWTELIEPFRKEYELYFKEALELLGRNPALLIPKRIYKEQLMRMQKHMGFSDKNQIKVFSEKVIASYAAEGMVFNLLSDTKNFRNCAWLNIREVEKRTAVITNCLRLRYGLRELPNIVCGKI